MKRSPMPDPTPEQVARWEDRRRASVAKWREKPRKPVAKKNAKRLARLRDAQYGPPGFVEWVHSLGCSVPSCGRTEIEAAHATSRGAGGDWRGVLPLCSAHHEAQHRKGIETFERHVGFRLSDVADAVHQRWIQFAGREDAA